jgi:DNA-binding protein WhiA
MSFTTDVKAEIAQTNLETGALRAQTAALIQLCSSLNFSSEGMQLIIRTENAATAKRIFKLLKEVYKVPTELSVMRKMKLKKNNVYTLKVIAQVREVLEDLGLLSDKGLQSHPARSLVAKESGARAYLAGAFLASGSVNSPQKTNYHLEIVTQEEDHAKFIEKLMRRFDLPAKTILRRKQYVVYLKASDKISDFLRLCSANNAVLDFEEIRIERDFHNSLTRLDNCEVANEMKSQAAAAKQIEAIEKLRTNGKLDSLEMKLREIADLRIDFTEASLNELCDEYEIRTGTVMSKSGMKHRFTKIKEIAQKIM